MKGGRVSYSWCMGVVSHFCDGLSEHGMEVVDDMHARQIHGFWLHVIRCRAVPECDVKTLMTPDHATSRCAALVGLSRN